MRYKATPFTMTELGLTHPERVAALMAGRSRVGVADEYRERATIEVNAMDATAAADCAWYTFQNFDEDHVTPDGQESMQVDDLVRVVDELGATTWWQAARLGFLEVAAPAELVA